MSGHSKWHNIKVKKMATDAKRGKTYTKYARLIEIAAREGGGDLSSNVRLRTLVDSAKSESVPNVNIDRAIQKGTGALKGDAMEEVTYEAYGPSGSAFIIEALTDNKNRTLSNVKEILSKNGGHLASNGAVMWMFARKGVVLGKRSDGASALGDDLELALIEAGAEDIQEHEGQVRVLSDGHVWTAVRDALKAKNYEIESAGLQYIAGQTAPVDSDAMTKVGVLLDALEEDDDVSEVHTNAVPQ